MSRIFECKETMPPTSNSDDVVRTALSFGEHMDNRTPGIVRMPERDVKNIERPVRGRPY